MGKRFLKMALKLHSQHKWLFSGKTVHFLLPQNLKCSFLFPAESLRLMWTAGQTYVCFKTRAGGTSKINEVDGQSPWNKCCLYFVPVGVSSLLLPQP